MTMSSFYNPTRVRFFNDVLESLPEVVLAERCLLVTTSGFRRRGVVSRIQESMENRIVTVLDSIPVNPDVVTLDRLRRKFQTEAHSLECIIALGGGSAIDTAKTLSVTLLSEPHLELSDFLRKTNRLNEGRRIPVVAIPTTAGTGSEVTPTATIWDFEHKAKYALSGDDLFPQEALIDPTLTYDLPIEITLSSGLDAISHALESVWNLNANPITLALASQSLRLSLKSLPLLQTDKRDTKARSRMLTASLLAGLAISQTRTALAHSISYPLTIDLAVPHGIACGFALPEILKFNSLSDDGRLARLARDLDYGTIEELSRGLEELLATLTSHSRHLISRESLARIETLRSRMISRGRVENNLRPVRQEDIDMIISKAVSRYS